MNTLFSIGMSETYITVTAPNATKLAEVVEDVPIREGYYEEELGGEVSVVIHSGAIDDPEELMDDIVGHSSISASQISIK